jgi:hypothetical protein
MKYYLEITMLNQQIFNTGAFDPEYARTIPDTILVNSKEKAQQEIYHIFKLIAYKIDNITFPVSQIAYITIKESI